MKEIDPWYQLDVFYRYTTEEIPKLVRIAQMIAVRESVFENRDLKVAEILAVVEKAEHAAERFLDFNRPWISLKYRAIAKYIRLRRFGPRTAKRTAGSGLGPIDQ